MFCRLSTEKDQFDIYFVCFSCPYTGKLNGLASVEFFAGTASFSDLSIDHEDKSYVLNFEAFTVASSRYQFSVNATPFDVKERVLDLVITQQPGKACAKTLFFSCCFKHNGIPTKGRLFKAVRISFFTLTLIKRHSIVRSPQRPVNSVPVWTLSKVHL